MPPSPPKPKTIIDRAKALRRALKDLDEAGGTRLMWTAETQGEVAEFFGVSIDTVKNWAKQRMPGKPRNYRLDKITNWLRTEGPGSKALKGPSDDPLLSGGDSVALERYRLAKAKHAELDLEQRKNELLDKEKCRQLFTRWAHVMRRMGDRLTKRYGVDANHMVIEAIDECHSIVKGEVDGGDDS